MILHLLLLIVVLIWGWSFVASKVALQEMSAVDLMGLRLLLALPALGTLLVLGRQRLQFNRRELLRLALAGGVLTAHYLIQINGIKLTSATNTGWLIAVTPLCLVLLSVLFLNERFGFRALLGTVLATLGVLLLVSRGELRGIGWLRNLGDWLVLASTLTWAVFTVLLRDLSRARPPIAVTLTVLIPPSLVAAGLISAGPGWSRFLDLSPRAVVAVLFLGLLATAIAHWLWQLGVARIGAARAGLFLYLEPLATTALAVPYLGEPFGWSSGLGGFMVLCGVYLAERRSAAAPTATRPAPTPE